MATFFTFAKYRSLTAPLKNVKKKGKMICLTENWANIQIVRGWLCYMNICHCSWHGCFQMWYFESFHSRHDQNKSWKCSNSIPTPNAQKVFHHLEKLWSVLLVNCLLKIKKWVVDWNLSYWFCISRVSDMHLLALFKILFARDK